MQLNAMLAGAIVMACLIVGLCFLRFWRSTHDRFFLYFSMSFVLEAVNRAVLGISSLQNEDAPVYYSIRLVSYALILFAILEKNRNQRK